MANEETALRTTGAELPRLNIDSLKGRLQLIEEVKSQVMVEGEDYGIIPGTPKPTLYKPGAEKLCITFMLDPEYEEVAVTETPDFVSYRIRCTLYHQGAGIRIGSGLGACNSREEKYRWTHKTDPVDPPKMVPKSYWDARNAGDSKEMKRILGEGMRAAKIDGAWMVCHDTRVENDNPLSLQNTIYKMSCKRSLVAAVLNATGASHKYTQDMEDMTDTAQEPAKAVEAEFKDLEEGNKPEAKTEAKMDTSEMTEPEKEKVDLMLFFESEMAPTPFKNLKTTLEGKVGVKESLLNQLNYLREKKKEWKK
jgi:hypothetical protein